jgi:hypothetical protein
MSFATLKAPSNIPFSSRFTFQPLKTNQYVVAEQNHRFFHPHSLTTVSIISPHSFLRWRTLPQWHHSLVSPSPF